MPALVWAKPRHAGKLAGETPILASIMRRALVKTVFSTQKNPEPIRFGIEGPIIAMGRAREEGTNSGYCEMTSLKTENKSQNTPQSVKNDAGFAIWRKKILNRYSPE
jgi:hypothetical protein